MYVYEAVDPSGRKIRERSSHTDEASLRAYLKEKGLMPLTIRPTEAREGGFFERVAMKDLLVFTQELGNLLDAGLPIDRALYVLSEHAEKKAMRSIVADIYIDIQKGNTLSLSLSKHKVFPRVYVNMVKAGESGGIIETVIKRLAIFLQASIAFREEIVSAMIYPILLTTVGGLAIAVLMLYVIPNFAKIFTDMGQALPLPTLILIKSSNALGAYWWLILGGLLLAVLAVRGYIKTAEGRTYIDTMKLRIPGIRTLNMKLVIARFSRTFGTLLQSGVPIIEAIRISRDVVDNDPVSKQLAALEEGVSKGRGLALPLKESGIFPGIVSQMVAVGEEAGRLEETFMLIAERFEAETKSLIKRFISLFEPALILLMGLVVGFIVIAMLVGIFSINDIPL